MSACTPVNWPHWQPRSRHPQKPHVCLAWADTPPGQPSPPSKISPGSRSKLKARPSSLSVAARSRCFHCCSEPPPNGPHALRGTGPGGARESQVASCHGRLPPCGKRQEAAAPPSECPSKRARLPAPHSNPSQWPVTAASSRPAPPSDPPSAPACLCYTLNPPPDALVVFDAADFPARLYPQ